VELLDNKYQKILDSREKIRNYETSKLSKDINNDILKEFNIEFTELEQFSNNLVDYANKTDILIKNLKDIPTN
jgi:TRAP-type mannitol/chloroaromatic compound transport system substrate-binding protein